jgi:hypothetical protein
MVARLRKMRGAPPRQRQTPASCRSAAWREKEKASNASVSMLRQSTMCCYSLMAVGQWLVNRPHQR